MSAQDFITPPQKSKQESPLNGKVIVINGIKNTLERDYDTLRHEYWHMLRYMITRPTELPIFSPLLSRINKKIERLEKEESTNDLTKQKELAQLRRKKTMLEHELGFTRQDPTAEHIQERVLDELLAYAEGGSRYQFSIDAFMSRGPFKKVLSSIARPKSREKNIISEELEKTMDLLRIAEDKGIEASLFCPIFLTSQNLQILNRRLAERIHLILKEGPIE